MNNIQRENAILDAIMEGYSTGSFEKLFPFMTEDYEHASFWVLEVIRGKKQAQEYYTGKGNAMRSSGSLANANIVKITSAPSVVRPRGIYQKGVKIEEDPSFLNRSDEGKKAILMTQRANGKESETLVIPTITGEGLLRQLLLTDPAYYRFEKCPVMDWGKGIPKYSKEDILKGMELQAFCVDMVAHMMEDDGYTINCVNDKFRPTQVFASKAGRKYDVIVAGDVLPYKGKIPYEMKKQFSSFCKNRGDVPLFASVSIVSDDIERAAAELALKYDGFRIFREMEDLSNVKEPCAGGAEYKQFVTEQIAKAYRTGCFDIIANYFDKSIVFRSQWLGIRSTGKASVIDYMNKNAQTARDSGSQFFASVVVRTRKHELKDLLRMMDEKPETYVLLKQEKGQEARWLLVIPQFNADNLISELLICDPAKHSFKPYHTFV